MMPIMPVGDKTNEIMLPIIQIMLNATSFWRHNDDTDFTDDISFLE